MATLEVRRLCAGYGRARVLFDVDFEVDRGEVLVLLGRNGAGKSTTLKAIMGLLPGVSGVVLLSNEEIQKKESFEIARLGLGYVPEERRIFAELSVAENLEVGRKPGRPGSPQWTVERVFDLFPSLRRRAAHPGGQLSGGEQQMLAVGRTLMGNPSVLLLDEPSEGLAPLVVESLVDAVLQLKRSGLAVVLCEQDARFAERVGDRACFISQGQVQARGGVRELRENLFR